MSPRSRQLAGARRPALAVMALTLLLAPTGSVWANSAQPPTSARPTHVAAPAPRTADRGKGKGKGKGASEPKSTTPAPAPAPAPSPTPGKGGDGDGKASGGKGGKPKVFDFTGLDLNGRLRTPQLLYFLERASEELERASLRRRSFIPELVRSIDEEAL